MTYCRRDDPVFGSRIKSKDNKISDFDYYFDGPEKLRQEKPTVKTDYLKYKVLDLGDMVEILEATKGKHPELCVDPLKKKSEMYGNFSYKII